MMKSMLEFCGFVTVAAVVVLLGAGLASAGQLNGQNLFLVSESFADGGAAGGAAAQDPSCGGCGTCGGCGSACCEPIWTVSLGAMILHRSPAHSARLVTNRQGRELLNADDFDLGFAAGPRIGLVRHLECWDVELLYYGIDNWHAARSVTSESGLLAPDYTDEILDHAGGVYSSRLYNIESNMKRCLTDRINFLVGFRMIQLHERILGDFQGETCSGSVDLRTNNYLTGLQIGSEARLWDCCGPLHVDGFVKAGVFNNHINARSVSTGDMSDFDVESGIDHIAFVAETGLTASYCLNDHLSIFGGYQVMWIGGVALAPDVLMGYDGTKGTPFYHGALAGVEMKW